MSRDKPKLRERIARAMKAPGEYVDRRDGEPLDQWQVRAVEVVVERTLTHSHNNQRRIGLYWLTEKAYAWLNKFEPPASRHRTQVGGAP